MEINRKTMIVSETGGTLDFVRDGEILASIRIPAGRVRAADYLDLAPDGASIELGLGLVALEPRHRIGIQPYGEDAYDSGANPDYRPTSASRLEREMRLTMNRMQVATSRLEARELALASIERIPKAPAPDPVIEPDPAPAPQPANDD